jgi:DNA-directed RNA polymerase subunit RPC12/RpoP
MCGATDCPSCYPENFVRGRYRYIECAKCGAEFEPDHDDDDVSGICEDCRQAEEQEEDEDTEETSSPEESAK